MGRSPEGIDALHLPADAKLMTVAMTFSVLFCIRGWDVRWASLLLVLLAAACSQAPSGDRYGGNLSDKELRYLIGTSGPYLCAQNEVTVIAYDAPPVSNALCVVVRYGNLFDEQNTGEYGPYLHTSDTAKKYGEGQIDPRGAGWDKNLRRQFERALAQGINYIELDNADAYHVKDVAEAVDFAAQFGIGVLAKNPLLLADSCAYVGHPNIFGVIVERGAGSPALMQDLRNICRRHDLPVWFVAFGKGLAWAKETARAAVGYQDMHVTYSRRGEYGSSCKLGGNGEWLGESLEVC